MTFEELMKKPELSPDETKKALELASRQTESCLSEFSSQFKSVYSENGFYTPVPNEQWTNGFWTGELWLAYENTGDERYREAALKQAESFLERIETGNHTDTHDLGFLYSLSCVSGYKLTGNETAKKAALLAADRLKSRFHEKGQFLQAWGVYGLALSYRYTRSPEYLEDFKHVTDYFLTHLPENLVPYWDFIFEDGSGEPWDSSASAIAVCGILEMCRFLPEAEAAPYLAAAKRLMKALTDLCAVTSPESSNGQLLHGVYGKKTPYNDCIDHGIDECNLWGDYFYVEALTRLTKDWNPYW